MDILALLFPKEKKFYRMIEEQVSLVGEAVISFEKLIRNYAKLKSGQKSNLISSITTKEKADDELYTKMVQALKSTFITPMDREDLHQLVVTFDTVINTLELLTQKLTAFKIKSTDAFFVVQAKILKDTYAIVEKLILSIRNEKEAEKLCIEIRDFEQRADDVYIKALKNLFTGSVAPLTIIKKKDLYTSMERMIDQLNNVALIIENLVVKYS